MDIAAYKYIILTTARRLVQAEEYSILVCSLVALFRFVVLVLLLLCFNEVTIDTNEVSGYLRSDCKPVNN